MSEIRLREKVYKRVTYPALGLFVTIVISVYMVYLSDFNLLEKRSAIVGHPGNSVLIDL